MSRNTLNFLIDGLTLLTAVSVLATGLLLRWVLPPRSGRTGMSLWTLDRHEWGQVHFWTAATLIVFVLVHLALHWQWVCTTAARFCLGSRHGAVPAGRRHAIGATAICVVVALVGGFVAIARLTVTTR